jgi:hypothetical protein
MKSHEIGTKKSFRRRRGYEFKRRNALAEQFHSSIVLNRLILVQLRLPNLSTKSSS